MKFEYINSYNKLNCCSDVTEIINPNIYEISEAIAIRNIIRGITFSNKKKYTHIDLCSRSALAPILTAFTLPVEESIAIDINPPQKAFEKVDRFSYFKADIYNLDQQRFKDAFCPDNEPIILTSSNIHGNLAKRVVEIYNNIKADKHLIILIDENIDQYAIYNSIKTSVCNKYIKVNDKILSDKNYMIIAKNRKKILHKR